MMFSVLSWSKTDASLSPYPTLLDLLFKPIIIYGLMSELLFPKSYTLQVAEPGLKSGCSDS